MSFDKLRAAFEAGRLPHALLLTGPVHGGQNEAAFQLATLILCDSPGPGGACGICVQCRQSSQKAHPDLVLPAPEEDSRVIKIKTIQSDVVAASNLKPFQARSKVFLIERAELMTEDAQNALLKTLEEPQGRSHLILVTSSPESLLQTIRSRTQIHYFSISASERMLDEDTEAEARLFVSWITKEAGARMPDYSKTDRREIVQIFDYAIEYFRDALVIGLGAPSLSGVRGNSIEKDRLAKRIDAETFAELIETLSEYKEKVLENINIRILMNVLGERLEKTHV